MWSGAFDPSFEGLCADLVDASALLEAGEPDVLATTTVQSNGEVSWFDVTNPADLPLALSVRDCDTANTTVFTSSTLVPGSHPGDLVAWVVTMEVLSRFQDGVELAGYTGDPLRAAGLFFGFVREDSATEMPIRDAVVSCTAGAGCQPSNVFYLDPSPATPEQSATDQGVFTSGTLANGDIVKNAETSSQAGAAFLVPAAPVADYTADDGGAHGFGVVRAGADPDGGSAVLGVIYGSPAAR